MGASFNVTAEVARISAELRDLSSSPVDPSPIIRTSLPFYGVKVDHLRRVARSWRREHRDLSAPMVAELCDQLWHRAVREEMVVAALIHGHDGPARSRFGLRTVDRWAKLVDNWEIADALGAWLAARAVGDDPARRYPMLGTLVGRRNPWSRRVGLVGSLGTARDAEAAGRWWPRVASMVLSLSGDKEAGIPKAISWVLREHTRHSADEVAAFVQEHTTALPAVAVRETRNKLRTGKKNPPK